MLPEARIKKPEYTQLISLLQTQDQLVKLRVSLINKIHSLFNSNGIKIKKEVLTSKEGFERVTQEHTWLSLEQIEIDIIAEQLEAIRKSLKKLEKEITSFAQNLSGYKNLISIKGMSYIKKKGYRTWYHKSYYGCRNKVENTFYRLKIILAESLIQGTGIISRQRHI
ncbi:MAG: hypothetical protein J0H12_07470 [Candidatus Paracaedimonas acanthamoebae]|uniref:Uncharacterized protein n=1 Tax=Candidatus Paracaedimonas acanthamoebae TaxID=244581 RepID=A0A8J7TV17_9PROT|nr:hypothetical protein [Candidatus Paracaedimonas acanthamoebae]